MARRLQLDQFEIPSEFLSARRNRIVAGLIAVHGSSGCSTAGTVVGSYLSIKSEAAQAAWPKLRQPEQLYKANILLAQSAMDRNLSGRARQALERTPDRTSRLGVPLFVRSA